MRWPKERISDEQLFRMLMSHCARGGCTTCGGVWALAPYLIRTLGSERALEHRISRLHVYQLSRLVKRWEFYEFLNLLSLPVWTRLAWRLTDRYPGLIRQSPRPGDEWPSQMPSRPISVRDCMVAMRSQHLGNTPRPTPRRQLPSWTQALYDDLIPAWDAQEERRLRREAEMAEHVRQLEAWRAATPNWREIEAARLEELRRPERERRARIRAREAAEQAAKRRKASIGLKKPIERNDIRRVTALLNRGADPHYQFVNGDTAIEYAARLRRKDLLALLREWATK